MNLWQTAGFWSLWDFGCTQLAGHFLTGEFLKVHGPDSLFADGPFDLVCDEGSSNRALLVGLDGSDEDCALHIVDEHAEWEIAATSQPACGDKPDYLLTQRCSNEQGKLLSDLQKDSIAHVLKINVKDFEEFKCEFVWHAAPVQCGQLPVHLWMNLRWLSKYLFPDVDGHRHLQALTTAVWKSLADLGFDASHCSVQRQTHADVSPAAKSQRQPCGDKPDGYHLSMVGVFVCIEAVMTNKNVCRNATDTTVRDQRLKAAALFEALWQWPLGENIAMCFRCDRSELDMLMRGCVVDRDAVAESDGPRGADANKRGKNRLVRSCCVHAHTHIHMYTHTRVHTHAHTYRMHIHTYTHTYTYRWACALARTIVPRT